MGAQIVKHFKSSSMAYINCRTTTSVEKREEIIALWSSGVRQPEIPERVGLSRKTVTNIINKFCNMEPFYRENLVGKIEQFQHPTLWSL